LPLRALTRPVPDSIPECELTHLERVPIDVARARAQHAQYERALVELGCTIERIPAAHDLPDSVFVEDTAIVLDVAAIMTRPGAESRRPEVTGVALVLEQYRSLAFIEAPGTLDGGDVLTAGRDLYVGVSVRTNWAAIDQLAIAVEPFGYTVTAVVVDGCLHLKSAVTALPGGRFLVNPEWIDVAVLRGGGNIHVHPDEPSAGNVLAIRDTVLIAASAPATRARLEEVGLKTKAVDVSELAKAEAGLTCCSLIVP
jgi:dimethylargininase